MEFCQHQYGIGQINQLYGILHKANEIFQALDQILNLSLMQLQLAI